MIRSLLFFAFICNMQCSNDFGERSFDQSQTRDENIEMSDPNEEMNVCRASKKNCSDMNVVCMHYENYNESCIYGDYYTLTCRIMSNYDCLGERTFQKVARCQFCYQTENWEHTCVLKHSCSSVASPPYYYKTNCTVHGDVICLGNRRFPKKLRCNWTRGHKWSTALILSITLGGFGADRFYLGHWQEGIGKLFSFGGLGVWTLVDVLLIAIRYLGPADGSFYV